MGQPALVVDAGPLYAYVDADDGRHGECLEAIETHRGLLVLPVLVIAEVSYLLSKWLGPVAEIRFLEDVASGVFAVESVGARDWERTVELVARYRDLPLGTTDASVVATAERLGATKVLTLDRRHFSVVRPAHVEAFELLP